MATKSRSTRWAFPTLLTDLATNTTLATATRHDFAVKTIYVPEGTRTVKSAFMRFSFTSADAAAAVDIDGVRLGAKVGAAAFVDGDTTYTAINTAEAETMVVLIDCTSNVVTNMGAGASFTLQGGIAVATGAISAVRNITCEFVLTYEYDDVATTHIKTVIIPLQSDVTDLGIVFSEPGSAGTAPAPANQIPQLTGAGSFLPESAVVIRDSYIRITAHSYGTPAVTDFNMDVRLDGVTTLARATFEAALQTSVKVIDIVDSALMPSAGAVHAFELKSSLADRFFAAGGEMVVTYEYDPASATHLNSVVLPLENDRSTVAVDTSATATHIPRLVARLAIQEPAAITIKQSGVVLCINSQGAVTHNVAATGQTTRPYVGVAAMVQESNIILVHRCDHSLSNWALARGDNTLGVDYSSAALGHYPASGYAIINYTSGKAASGAGSHNHTLLCFQKAFNGVPAVSDVATPTPPAIPESTYRISGAFVDVMTRTINDWCSLGMERLAGEDCGAGWYLAHIPNGNMSTEIGIKNFFPALSRWFRDSSYKTAAAFGANVETSRSWRYASVDGEASSYASMLALTYHSCEFTVAGAVTVGGAPVVNGKTVNVYAINADGSADLIGSPVTGGGTGAFTVETTDSTRTHFASYKDAATLGRSDDGTPETSTFNVAIGGGADVTAPTITIVSPTPGVAPGGPGGFPADWLVARNTPIVLEVTDVAPGLQYLCVVATFPGGVETIVYRRGAFRGKFAPLSSVEAIANGFRFTTRYDDGWPPGNVTFNADALDGAGNLAA